MRGLLLWFEMNGFILISYRSGSGIKRRPSLLSNETSVTPEFTPDLLGEYTLSLVVNDGTLDSTSDDIVVTVYNPFVIENLGVTFAPYDSGTNWAGDFIFGCTDFYKVFIEFAAIVPGHGDQTKTLPTFDYIVDASTTITAVADGIVTMVCWQNSTSEPPDPGYSQCDNISWDVDDYEIVVLNPGNPTYDVEYDHVTNPQVQIGDVIKAGDPIGNPGITSHTCDEYGGTPLLGRTEISVSDYETNNAICPFTHFNAATRETYEDAVSQMMSDWEQFVFDNYGITGDYEATFPKAEQVYDDENHPVPGCVVLEM